MTRQVFLGLAMVLALAGIACASKSAVPLDAAVVLPDSASAGSGSGGGNGGGGNPMGGATVSDGARSEGAAGNGGNTASGGSPTGGATAGGGSGGGAATGSGGHVAGGGNPTGGATANGGSGSGAAIGSGGHIASGGNPTGGATANGGSGSGAATGSGGNAASGGNPTGGATANGGRTGTGGGGAATGGADASIGQGGIDGSTSSVAYPLKVAPGKRHLVTQDGRPYLFAGEAAWSLAAGLTTPEQTQYLDDRASRGFNTALVNLIEHYYLSHSYGAPYNAYGEAPFTAKIGGSSWNMSTPNEAYWARVDQLIDAAAARGIQILAVPAYLGLSTFEGWSNDMAANSSPNLQAYGTFLGNRYKSRSNLIWVMGGDLCPAVLDATNNIAEAIRAADRTHLMTAHGRTGITTDCFSSSGWLDFGAIYVVPPSAPGPVWQTAREAYARTPVLPFVHIEGAYEGESATSLSIRQEVYESLLNGGFGHLYGDSPIWKAGSGWQAALAAPGAQDNARAFALFSARSWELLVPDVSLTFMTAGAGSGAGYASAALSSDGKLAIAYTPASRALTFNMSKLSGSATVRWYDPTSGNFTAVVGSPFANSGSQTFTPTGNNSRGEPDRVLVFEAQ